MKKIFTLLISIFLVSNVLAITGMVVEVGPETMTASCMGDDCSVAVTAVATGFPEPQVITHVDDLMPQGCSCDPDCGMTITSECMGDCPPAEPTLECCPDEMCINSPSMPVCTDEGCSVPGNPGISPECIGDDCPSDVRPAIPMPYPVEPTQVVPSDCEPGDDTCVIAMPVPIDNCPIYTSPPPGWCAGGQVLPPLTDENGCYGPPRCAECPSGCTCDEDEVKCPTGGPIDFEVGPKGGRVSIEKGSGEMMQVSEGQVSVQTKEKLIFRNRSMIMTTAKGDIEVKVMPSEVSNKAQTQLRMNEFDIELKEDGMYNVKGQSQVRILGLFKTEMQVESKINAQTGTVEETKKPWWSFLAFN